MTTKSVNPRSSSLNPHEQTDVSDLEELFLDPDGDAEFRMPEVSERVMRVSHSSRRRHHRIFQARSTRNVPELHTWPVTDEVIDNWFRALSEETSDASLPMLSERVLDEARRIVRALRRQLPLDTDVYPMDEGKVAIELYGEFGHGFLLVCEPGGSALCIVTVDGISRRARYESSSVLPDGFLQEGLRDVRPVS